MEEFERLTKTEARNVRVQGRNETKNDGERLVQTSSLPGWTADDIRATLRRYNRAPFQDLLSVWLETAPDVDTLKKWARQYPDRWAAAITQLAKVAGFSERREVLSYNFSVADMSDSQLEDQIIAIGQHAGIEPAALIEAITAVMNEGSTHDGVLTLQSEAQSESAAREAGKQADAAPHNAQDVEDIAIDADVPIE